MWEPGQRIGDYELVANLRAGGMATLFLGRRLGAAGFARDVAIKIVHPQLAADEQFRAMFLDEAMLSSRIEHPNVVHVEELGEHQGSHFLVMEYVHGCSLSQLQRALLARGRRLSPAFAVRIAMHVAEGLHAAHETRDEHGRLLEVVHRDVSPENILLAYAGHVKLIDFGIAKAYGRRHRTQEGLLKGKFRYMAPEQAYGKAIDRRTDLYQLAIVLWELLTLRRLFDAETDVALLQQVRDPKIVAPGTLVKGIPPALDATLMSALDPDPTRRPPDAQTFARMLGKALPAAREVDGGALSSLVVALMQEQRAREKRTLPPHVYERLERQLPTAQMGSNAEKPERAAAKHTLEHTSPYGSDVAAPGSVAPPAHGGTAPGYGTSPSHASRAVPGRSVRAAEESPRRRRLVRIASEIKTTITRIAEGEVSARRMFWLSALGAIGLGGALALLTLALRAPRSAPPPPPPAPVVAGMEAAHDAVDAAHPSSALAPFAPRDGGALDALAPEPTLSASADPTDAQRPAGTMRAQPAKLPAPVSVDGTPLVMQPGF